MKQFSFFKQSRRGGSGTIRANQIGEFLKAKINPKSGYENDICIYVKHIPKGNMPRSSYLDIIDKYPRSWWFLEQPSLGVVTVSRAAQRLISQMLDKDVVFIPQHHCNYLRESREGDEVRTVGVIGAERACEIDYDLLTAMLKDIGLDFIHRHHPSKRMQVVDFYKTIDVQIVFRPSLVAHKVGVMFSSLKIANASSFGIPTVAYPEPSHIDEFDGCFLPAFSPEEVILNVKRLKEDKGLYKEYSIKAKEMAEKYHIGNIAELYKQLL